MSEIKPIGDQSIHQICSGQVILNLATAVKELLENALDAGASSIEIKLKEYGMSSIEVSDNGDGIEEVNYEGLTKKHYTSKLQEFTDLTSVETFGFRGEALSSLCALSNMAVMTRFKTSKSGHRLEYDKDGKLLKKSCIARQPGTSVVLRNIFVPLPVRHVEFQKNIKREFSKLLTLLYSYCIICTDVQISCSNDVKGAKREVLRTSGSKTTKDNIITLFGSKLFKSLIPFDQSHPTMEFCENYHISHRDCLNFCKDSSITGYISSCGSGRRSSDMQFMSVNKRPCHVPKLTKLVNEVYRLFNKSQYPFIQLDISTKRDQVDINVTPDKRQVFLTHEKALFAIFKSSLLKIYNGMTHEIETMKSQPSILSSWKCSSGVKSSNEYGNVLDECRSTKFTKSPIVDNGKNFKRLTQFLAASETQSLTDPTLHVHECGDSKTERKRGIPQHVRDANFPNKTSHSKSLNEKVKPIVCVEEKLSLNVSSQNFGLTSASIEVHSSENDMSQPKNLTKSDHHGSLDCNTESERVEIQLSTLDSENSKLIKSVIQPRKRALDGSAKISSCVTTDCTQDSAQRTGNTCEALSFSFSSLKKDWRLKEKVRRLVPNSREDASVIGMFQARIVSSDNDKAEKELSKHFERSSFKTMEVIGQFNLGFIIARYGKDLFIIDQHASDEKYNFEILQKTTKLKGQPLIVPQKLELTASGKIILEENMEIFTQNGFSFDIRQSDEGPKSVYLLKVPSSKNMVFDASDVAELIFILGDYPHVLCRPSRIKQMFASRACRKSIMIGSYLTFDAMRQIVDHMSQMDQPWNCPHGRPTMRHLVDLTMIMKPASES